MLAGSGRSSFGLDEDEDEDEAEMTDSTTLNIPFQEEPGAQPCKLRRRVCLFPLFHLLSSRFLAAPV